MRTLTNTETILWVCGIVLPILILYAIIFWKNPNKKNK